MSDNPPSLAGQFPVAVQESLAELRAAAKAAKSRDDIPRRATADEIALALTQRKPHHCTGHSSRTGLPCTGSRLLGMTVCKVHGGALKRVKAKAANRLREMVDPALDALLKLATQDEHKPAAVNAARDLLDRAGIGELVEAKVRTSRHGEGGNRVVVSIGFLSAPGETPLTHRRDEA